MAFKLIIWHRNVCDDQLIGWLQHTDGDPVCRDPPAHGHHTGFICTGFPSPMGTAGERPEFDIKPLFGAPLLIFPQGKIFARQRALQIRVFLLGELPKAIKPHLPVYQIIPLATRSNHAVFANDQVIRAHCSFCHSGGLPRGNLDLTQLICLQLSCAKGTDNGGVSGHGRRSD